MLDSKRLGAQIYEGIHILASLLGVNDKLVNPKRDVNNHPAARLWKGYEDELMYYIIEHQRSWNYRYAFKEDSINNQNIRILMKVLNYDFREYKDPLDWITDELIEVHRSVLYAKKPEYYSNVFSQVTEGLNMRYDWRCE
jgi:hypothetical protein